MRQLEDSPERDIFKSLLNSPKKQNNNCAYCIVTQVSTCATVA